MTTISRYPILAALLRSKAALFLLGLQVALVLAVLTNAFAIVADRWQRIHQPSGMNEADTFVIRSNGFASTFQVKNTLLDDLRILRGLPGVASVTPAFSVPMSGRGVLAGVRRDPAQATAPAFASFYFGDEQALATFDARLVGGRNFSPDEVEFHPLTDGSLPHTVIVSAALGEALFNSREVVGKQIYLDQNAPPSTIVGVVDPLVGIERDRADYAHTVLVPKMVAYENRTNYLVRAQPGQRDALMTAAEKALADAHTDRVILEVRSIESIRDESYSDDRTLIVGLGVAVLLLLAILALGILGMASFWVAERTTEIGARRALGARRSDIRRYFQTENLAITVGGIVVGLILAYALNLELRRVFDVPALPLIDPLLAALALLVLGQVSVLSPALRATRIPPSIATRGGPAAGI